VTSEYLSLLKATGEGRPAPSALKNAVTKKSRQFSGYAQEDAY
jgi:hypothetical protein